MLREVVVGMAAGAALVGLGAALLARLAGGPARPLAARGAAAGAALGLAVGSSYGRLGVAAVPGGALAGALSWLLVALVFAAGGWWGAVEREPRGRRTELGVLVFAVLCVGLALLALPAALVGLVIAWAVSLVAAS